MTRPAPLNRALRRSAFSAALLAAVALASTACVPTRSYDRPDVVWSDGKPAGPLEDSPWVQAVRASELELAISHYALNFGTTELAQTTSSGRINTYRSWISGEVKDSHWPFPPGPDPMIPLYVKEASDGQSAKVWVCVAFAWEVNAHQPEPPENPVGILSQKVVRLEDGNYIVSHNGAPVDPDSSPKLSQAFATYRDDREESDCLLESAKIGMFDPAPDVTVQYDTEDIKPWPRP